MGSLVILNIGLDLYSVLICVLLGVHALLERDARLRIMNRCFAGICFSNALMALSDMTSWAPPAPLDHAGYMLVVLGSFGFYFAYVPIYLCLMGYLVSYFDQRAHRERSVGDGDDGPVRPVVSRAIILASAVVLAVHLAVCVASVFGDVLFTVTPQGGYMRGPLFWVSEVTVTALHALSAVIILSQARTMTWSERFGFASWVLLPVCAHLVQASSFGIALLNQSITLSLLIMSVGIQSERRALLAVRDEELTEMRTSMMLSQIQPHFLFNALAAIRELCRTDARAAVEMVTDFSAYLRENMQSLNSTEPIAVEQELAHTRTYLMLESRRFGERLSWEFDTPELGFALPPLSIQPLVENAVRHGIAPLEEGGAVRVATRACADPADGFEVVVTDDGAGFDVSVPAGEGHVGIENVRRRVRSLCGGSLSIESELGKGTRATLRIPLAGRLRNNEEGA